MFFSAEAVKTRKTTLNKKLEYLKKVDKVTSKPLKATLNPKLQNRYFQYWYMYCEKYVY